MTEKMFHITVLIVTWGTLLLAAALVLPGFAGYFPYVVLSGSMEPTVKTGSLAYISTAATSLAPGSIIAYELNDGTAVIHRIVDLDSESGDYITRGDANEVADGTPVAEEAILGVYAFSIPKVGYFLQGLKSPAFPFPGMDIPLPVCSLICALLALNLADYALCDAPKGAQKQLSERRKVKCLERE